MKLMKEGQTINLENENHISAFKSNGWTEAPASVPSKAEVQEEKKSASKKK